MLEHNITSKNVVPAAQFMLSLDNSSINKEYQQDSTLWIFNVEHALNYYLSLLKERITTLPHDKTFKQELSDSLLALKQYVINMFHILTLPAKKDLIRQLSIKHK